VKAVLFDLDDTLFDHRYAARCVLRQFRESHPALQAYSLEFLEQEDFRILGEKHAQLLAGFIDVDLARIQRIQALFACCGEHISTSYAQQLAQQRQSIYRESRRAVPGAIALLQALRPHVRIGVVTNNFTREQEGKLDACGLSPLVDSLVTSEDVKHTKPDPRIFEAALGQLNCDSHDAVMVGDSWEIDIVGALNAGIRPIWFNRYGAARPDHAEILELTSFEPTGHAASRIVSCSGGL
jgi:HAD superfamily hydrolase (TIGR01549 family)